MLSNLKRNLFLLSRIYIIIRTDSKHEDVVNLLQLSSDVVLLMKDNSDRILDAVEAADISDRNKTMLLYEAKNYNMGECESDASFLKYYDYVVTINKELIEIHNEGNFIKFYDLIDLIHSFPDTLVDMNEETEQRFHRLYITPFEMKWGEV